MRDGDGANKNKIAVFDFGVTPKHFPHDMLLNDQPLAKIRQRQYTDWIGR
jgi:hypothetical protein